MCRYKKALISQRNCRYPSVEAFDADRFLSTERFTLQNVLIRQYRFPTELRRGDYVSEFWSHTIPIERWSAALELIRERTPLSSRFLVDDSTDTSFLSMCQKLVGRDFKATGGIAVRFTGLTGRPAIRLTVVGIHNFTRTLYSNNDGPHVLAAGTRSVQQRTVAGLPGAWDSITEPPRASPAWSTLVAS